VVPSSLARLLQLEEIGAGRYAVLWKVPSTTYDPVRLVPQLPQSCRELDAPATSDAGVASITTWVVECGPSGLAGGAVRIVGLEQSSNDVLVSIVGASGAPLHAVLSSTTTAYAVPATPRLRQVFASYGALGVEHILTGYDTFDVIHVPSPPIEAMIAGSIVVLAAEVAAPGRRDTLVVRAPWVVTTIFGLFHGLGFAGALREIGLPNAATVPALAAFNIGVKVGQLGIVCACVLLGALLRRVRAIESLRDARLAAYPIGLIAAFWTIERVATALSVN
jgi:hypothetical protein